MPLAFAHKSISAGPPPSEDDADANAGANSDTGGGVEDQLIGEEYVEDADITPGGADHLSVMYPPCQDPLLVKIYQDLPTLPCVASIYFCNFCKI